MDACGVAVTGANTGAAAGAAVDMGRRSWVGEHVEPLVFSLLLLLEVMETIGLFTLLCDMVEDLVPEKVDVRKEVDVGVLGESSGGGRSITMFLRRSSCRRSTRQIPEKIH